MDKVGRIATQWVRTRAETVRIESDWAGERELLETMIRAVEERARVAEEQAEQVKGATAQVRAELEGLAQKNEVAEQSLKEVEARLKRFTATALALRPQLPPRLRDALELAYASLQNTELPPSERMQYLMTILGRCHQFNRTITAGEEVTALSPGATPRSVEAIYWGLSHGYALDRASGEAWLGASTAEGWTWEPLPGAADKVGRLLAIANDQADPDFVVLPAKLNHRAR